MSKTITAAFTTRRDAEMAVEHLVQEHGLDRNAVRIETVSDANTAGTEPAGGDVEGGHEKTATEGSPALAGKIKVSADVDEAAVDKVRSSFETYGGTGTAA
ncbi:hypothetical protein [Methylobacterium haplocladii]|uniref:Uncharacterized protein n=1 Tax=Methylobacterium haplocladii TaxID=1176176 RepID=A0A512ILE8_9HYPH|nr:hypothetical protein [Methylobacterium haplocladii]GEO98536.1 hypothetical protein MHA02_09240 [Methylobacterium haplocladii]GJD82841.1 hypothetical protein HPGCJGGD_0702 [Methylobacterium haplocladii]GLS61021.1 hypothetical protein GCM10007887_37140 [Methylobacterium haplocladii]